MNYNTEVTGGSDVIEVGFIALRYHYKRQWISQMHDGTCLIPNITWNNHNSHCWQYNNNTLIPGLVKKNVFRPTFLRTPHTINTTVQCYTSFQSKPNPQLKSRPQPTRPVLCVRACVRRVSFVCQQIQQQQWGGWKWTSPCGTERGDGYLLSWTRYYTNKNCYLRVVFHYFRQPEKGTQQGFGFTTRVVPLLSPV